MLKLKIIFTLVLCFATKLQGITDSAKGKILLDSVIKYNKVNKKPFSNWTQSVQIKTPDTLLKQTIDPLDPYNNKLIKKRQVSKLWFAFLAGLILLIVALFVQNYYLQCVLRIQSIYNQIKFKELLNEKLSSLRNGTIFLTIINTFFLASFLFLMLLRFKFYGVNHIGFYVLLLISLLIVKFLFIFLQWIQLNVFNFNADFLIQNQQEVNIEFILGSILQLLSLLLYFNPRLIYIIPQNYYVFTLFLYFGIRFCYQILGIFRFGNYSIHNLLYFCTFQILPMALFVKLFLTTIYARG